MLPHVSTSECNKFKKDRYRIRFFRTHPVTTISDIVQLGYLDVNRTLVGILSGQSGHIKKCVIDFINNLLASPPKSQSQFDELHHKCCMRCTKSPGSITIHYGQAQKLLNMSLKYLYNEFAIYGYKYFAFPNKIEYLFHLPIDNKILSTLVKYYGFSAPPYLPWSQWTYNNYIAFQTLIRNRLISNYKPLEIDYKLWNNPNPSSLRGVAIGSLPS